MMRQGFIFDRKNYFLRFKQQDHEPLIEPVSKQIRHALDYFLEDLNRDRNQTIERFLNESMIEEIFLSLAQLLTSQDER